MGFYKLKTDGSSLGNPGVRGIGRVVRNNKADWVLGFCKGYPIATNNQMELIAFLEGLKLVDHLYPVEINGILRR